MHPPTAAVAVLAELPHWHAIAHRFKAWAAEVERLHGSDAVLQAAIQAAHFSHSEVAVLAKELNNVPHQGRASQEILAEKLLLAVPRPLQGSELPRWTDGEKQNAFNRLKAIPAAALDLHVRTRPNTQMLRLGNSIMGRVAGGVVMIARTDLQGYECAVQLHVDALLAMSSGCRVSQLFAQDSHGAVSEVRFSREMLAEISRVLQHYQARLAVRPRAEADELLSLADRAAFLKLLGDAAYAEFKALEPALRQRLAAQHPRGTTVQLRALTVEVSEAGDLRFLMSRSPKISSLRDVLRRDVSGMLDTHLSKVASIDDVPEEKRLPATEITRKPARKPASQ